MIFWSMAWRSLRLHYRRSIVTGLAVALGFCGVVLLGGYMMRMENYLKTQAIYLSHSGHISIYKKDGLEKHLTDGEAYSLSLEDQKNILDAVQTLPSPPVHIAKYLHGQGLITNGCRSYPFFLTAFDGDSEKWIRSQPLVQYWTPELLQLKKGKGFWESTDADNSIVVAYRLARLLQKPLVSGDSAENKRAEGQLITDCDKKESLEIIRSHSGVQLISTGFTGGLAAADAKISGHYSTGLEFSDAGSILVPLQLAQSFYGTDHVTWIALFLNQRDVAKRVAKKLRHIFAERNLSYDVYDYRDARINQYYVGAMGFVYVMVLFFLILVCGVVALSILNSLQISLLERKIELGTLRSIGFKQSVVASLFVKEVFLLVSISLFVGGVLAYLIAAIINSMNLRFPLVGVADDIQFMLQPELWLTILIGSIFLGVACLTCHLECKRRLKARITSLLEHAS